jgi:hypothetical protein
VVEEMTQVVAAEPTPVEETPAAEEAPIENTENTSSDGSFDL